MSTDPEPPEVPSMGPGLPAGYSTRWSRFDAHGDTMLVVTVLNADGVVLSRVIVNETMRVLGRLDAA